MTTDPIVKTIRVGLDPDAAFDLFANRIAEWWPMERHSVSANTGATGASIEVEPQIGGALAEICPDGTRHIWGHFQEWAPGRAFAMTWHPGHGPERQTSLRVTFDGDSNGTTVALTHSGWEALEDGARVRTGYDGGWDGVLADYAAAVLEPAE